MEIGSFFISEEQIRFPDRVQHGWIQIKGVIWVLAVSQARVVPFLT